MKNIILSVIEKAVTFRPDSRHLQTNANAYVTSKYKWIYSMRYIVAYEMSSNETVKKTSIFKTLSTVDN